MVEKTVYRGTEAYCLQADALRAVMLRSGGKLASLEKDGVEYLYQGHTAEYVQPAFAGNYGECDLSGFDDMVPTINAGYVESGTFDGTKLTDHGEVWALDWDIAMNEDRLDAEVSGVWLPYRLKKRLIASEKSLRIEYELTNPTQFALPCLWASHMLICANENTRIADVGINRIRSTLDMNSQLGGFGALHSWPQAQDRQGNTYDLDRLPGRDARLCEKYYFDGKLREGMVKVTDPDLTLRFPVDTVPYLGIWLNSNGYKEQYNMGIEPATAPMDSPRIAKEWGYTAELAPKQKLQWFLELELG